MDPSIPDHTFTIVLKKITHTHTKKEPPCEILNFGYIERLERNVQYCILRQFALIDAQRLESGRVELAPVRHSAFVWTALRCVSRVGGKLSLTGHLYSCIASKCASGNRWSVLNEAKVTLK